MYRSAQTSRQKLSLDRRTPFRLFDAEGRAPRPDAFTR